MQVERPAERDALVRLATKPKILDYIIDKISSEFHPFLRKPISVMVDMLQFCGYVLVVAHLSYVAFQPLHRVAAGP